MNSLKELQDLIQEKFGIDPGTLDPNASIREKGLDSLAMVEYLFAVEDHFGVSISDDHSNIDTLSELAAVVDKLKAAQAA